MIYHFENHHNCNKKEADYFYTKLYSVWSRVFSACTSAETASKGEGVTDGVVNAGVIPHLGP